MLARVTGGGRLAEIAGCRILALEGALRVVAILRVVAVLRVVILGCYV